MVYVGLQNLVESATVTSTELANAVYLKDRLTSYVATSYATASVTITSHWGGVEKYLSSFAIHEHNGRDSAASGAQWRVKLYDNEDPSAGNLVEDSGPLPMLATYLATPSLDVWDEAQSIFTFDEVQFGRRVPRAIAAKSFQVVIWGPSFSWRLGYLWGGLSHALSSTAVLGAENGASIIDPSKPTPTFGAGVAFEPAKRPEETAWSFPRLSISDRANFMSLSAAAGSSSPWFLHASPGLPARDREAEGGVVRFTGPVSSSRMGSLAGSEALYKASFKTTRWR